MITWREIFSYFRSEKPRVRSWLETDEIQRLQRELASREKQVVKVLRDKRLIERRNAELNKRLVRYIRDHQDT